MMVRATRHAVQFRCIDGQDDWAKRDGDCVKSAPKVHLNLHRPFEERGVEMGKFSASIMRYPSKQ